MLSALDPLEGGQADSEVLSDLSVRPPTSMEFFDGITGNLHGEWMRCPNLTLEHSSFVNLVLRRGDPFKVVEGVVGSDSVPVVALQPLWAGFEEGFKYEVSYQPPVCAVIPTQSNSQVSTVYGVGLQHFRWFRPQGTQTSNATEVRDFVTVFPSGK